MPTSGIYYGLWTNWSRGRVHGATLTLSNHDASVIIALFALFVAFAVSKLWSILVLGIYLPLQTRFAPKSPDVDLLSILSRPAPPESTAFEILRLNRGRGPEARSKRTTYPWALLALVNYALVGAAGIFSPDVIKAAGGDALISGNSCAFEGYGAEETPVRVNQRMLNATTDALHYARNCYGGGSRESASCSRFPQRELNWTSESNVQCPFAPGICHFNTTSAYRMDTGLLDSHVDLGINAEMKDRLKFRKVTTCAVLNGTQFGKFENETDSASGRVDKYIRLYFGPLEGITDYTYSINMDAAGVGYGYSLTTYLAYTGSSTRTVWTPIPELTLNNADTSLLMLSANDITYISPVDDPLFAAQKPITALMQGKNGTYYLSNAYVRSLACAEQFQFCTSTNTDKCTNLTSSSLAQREAASIGLSPNALAVKEVLDTIFPWSNTAMAVGGNGAAALRAQESVFRLTQGPLPGDQWKVELGYWFSAALARVQLGVLRFAQGPEDRGNGNGTIVVVLPKKGSALEWVCGSVLVGDGGDQVGFRVLGMVLILVIGGLVVVCSWVLEGKNSKAEGKNKEMKKRNQDASPEAGESCVELQQIATMESKKEDIEPLLRDTAHSTSSFTT